MDRRQQEAVAIMIDRLLIGSAICVMLVVAACSVSAEKVTFLPTEKVVFTGKQSVSYPLRKSWWTVNGTHPSRAEMIKHLETGQHAGKFPKSYLNALSLEELHSLHSDDHEGKLAVGSLQNSRIVVVTTANCGPCRTWKAREKPVLQKAGYKFGTKGNVDFLEVSKYSGVRSVPAFILEINGRPVRRLVGYARASQLISMMGGKR
jgi:hypothetical protein